MPPEPEGAALLVDFGSTFTKLLLVRLPSGAVLARASHPTTVGEGVTVGLQAGLAALATAAGPGGERLVAAARPRLACSSAAGGLRMVAIGLVRDLTTAAATRAALGAGARLLATYCHRLGEAEVAEVGQRRPDVVLLTGGTDGGDRQTLLHNAAALAGLSPAELGAVVVAGNKEVTPEAVATLRRAGHDARGAPNVLPELGRLAVEPAQEAIRRLFLERIVQSKGLDQVQGWLDGVVMPTPAAALQGAELLADGPRGAGATDVGQTAGMGDLVVVDVGGATTDVHSVGEGRPRRPDVYYRGLPEPRAKRTVEGDLGLRESALSLWSALTGDTSGLTLDLTLPTADHDEVMARLQAYAEHTAQLPSDDLGRALDALLARGAVALALTRHAGTLEAVSTPAGSFWVQQGKDLSQTRSLIASGGIFHSGPQPRSILQTALRAAAAAAATRLVPRRPGLYVDREYVLWAAGLLATHHPVAAWHLARGSIEGRK
jgi:uncharacterized protein (TIGR01319 family)